MFLILTLSIIIYQTVTIWFGPWQHRPAPLIPDLWMHPDPDTQVADLPIFLLLAKKPARFLCLENIAIFYLPVTQNEPMFFRVDITKQHRNNETSPK